MKLKLAKKQPVAKNTVIFWFKPDRDIRYVAGQYIELHIPHAKPDERKTKRWFTLSSSPTENMLAITTKLDPTRPSTFKKTLFGLGIGTELNALMPMGDFVLPKDIYRPLVFIAGGIGITPYRSILKYLADTGENRDITLIYAVNDQDEIAFEEIIKASGVKFIKHLGKLPINDTLSYLKGLKNPIIYVSGPERMVENLQKDLIKNGVNNTNIRTDFFHNYD